MTYANFIELMLTYKKLNEDLSELYNMGFDLMEGKYKVSELTSKLFLSSFKSHYTEAGIEWIDWFIWENDWGQRDWSKIRTFDPATGKIQDRGDLDPLGNYGAKDENGNPICYSHETLWEHLQANHLIKNNL
jgi:hypothetical protein